MIMWSLGLFSVFSAHIEPRGSVDLSEVLHELLVMLVDESLRVVFVVVGECDEPTALVVVRFVHDAHGPLSRALKFALYAVATGKLHFASDATV